MLQTRFTHTVTSKSRGSKDLRYVELPNFGNMVLSSDGHFPTHLEMKAAPTLEWGIPLTDKEQVNTCNKCP